MYRKSIHIDVRRKRCDTDLLSCEGIYMRYFTLVLVTLNPRWSLDVPRGLFCKFSASSAMNI